MRKYMLALLLITLSMMFIACNNENNDSSVDEVSLDLSEADESKHIVTSKEATQIFEELLEKDKMNVSLFFENGMYELTDKTSDTLPIKTDSEFSSFQNVKELFSIYTFPDTMMDYFLGFPLYGQKSVYEKDGTVYASKNTSLKLDYPEKSIFSLTEFSEYSAKFAFETADGTKSVTLDFETKTLSDSPYRLMYAEDFSDKWESIDVPTDALNVGSGKNLLGDTMIINVFMQDKNTDWEEDEINEVLASLDTATEWITALAEENEVDLTLSSTTRTTSLYYNSSTTLPTNSEDQIWINQMFSYTTYSSIDEYIETNCDIKSCDNYIVLFHINKDGKNNFGRYDSSMFDSTLYNTERAVMYAKSSGVKDYLNAILSLFGAESLDKAKNEVTTYFGNEIMLSSTSFSDSAVMSDITAYLIGWEDSLYPQFTNIVKKIYDQNK